MRVLPLFLLLLWSPAYGQSSVTGRVSAAYEAVEGATLTIANSQGKLTATSNAAGEFRWAGVAAGKYDLTVEAAGYPRIRGTAWRSPAALRGSTWS
jgi:hypothetical protein